MFGILLVFRLAQVVLLTQAVHHAPAELKVTVFCMLLFLLLHSVDDKLR